AQESLILRERRQDLFDGGEALRCYAEVDASHAAGAEDADEGERADLPRGVCCQRLGPAGAEVETLRPSHARKRTQDRNRAERIVPARVSGTGVARSSLG